MDYKTSPIFLLAWEWVDNDWIFLFGWIYPKKKKKKKKNRNRELTTLKPYQNITVTKYPGSIGFHVSIPVLFGCISQFGECQQHVRTALCVHAALKSPPLSARHFFPPDCCSQHRDSWVGSAPYSTNQSACVFSVLPPQAAIIIIIIITVASGTSQPLSLATLIKNDCSNSPSD